MQMPGHTAFAVKKMKAIGRQPMYKIPFVWSWFSICSFIVPVAYGANKVVSQKRSETRTRVTEVLLWYRDIKHWI